MFALVYSPPVYDSLACPIGDGNVVTGRFFLAQNNRPAARRPAAFELTHAFLTEKQRVFRRAQ